VQHGVRRPLGDRERDVAGVGDAVALDELPEPPADLGDRLRDRLQAHLEALDFG
jgi:hypothetical protein